MKKLLLLFLLLLSGISQAQNIYFPDAEFKAALLSMTAVTTISGEDVAVNIDTDNNGEISYAEAAVITKLDFWEIGANFEDINGIENFTNLKELAIRSSVINTNFYLGSLGQLEKLAITGGFMTEFNVSNLHNLKELECDFSYNLTALDVSNLSNLEILRCSSSPLLATLTLGTLPNLNTLHCSGNNLATLDVSGATNLTDLLCDYNPLGTLDVTMLPLLYRLGCSANGLTSLDVTQCTNLHVLFCGYNQLTSIDLSTVDQLNALEITNNPISEIDLTDVPLLDNFHCAGTLLPSFDATLLPALQSLSFGSPQLTSVVLNPEVVQLYIYNSPIAEYNLNNFDSLHDLIIEHSALTAVDVSGCPVLNNFQLVSNPQLEYVNLKNGNMSMYNLDIIYNPNLVYICAEGSHYANLQSYWAGETQGNSPYLQVNPYCTFMPGGVNNIISGELRFDNEGDGCDTGDIIFPNANMVMANGPQTFTFSTNQTQDYRFYCRTGTYTLTPSLENPAIFNISPASATVTFDETNGQESTQNFCFTANGIHPDAEIMIVSTGMARPGFPSPYQIIYRNKGNQTLSGNITLTFPDSHSNLISSTPMGNQSGNTVSWNYQGLAPFETRTIQFGLQLNSPMDTPPLNDGDILDLYATMLYSIPDVATLSTNCELHQPLSNSFDPNDKACLEGNIISPEMIGDYVHYNINFENIGTAEAINVVVKDVIDTAKFDISTLQVVFASHPMVTRINGNVVEFIFENINLPSTIGQNKGNVVFKIRTKPTLVLGNSISNKAKIFFDYNFPIETNEATSTFSVLKNNEFKTDATIGIAPNPAKDKVSIKANSNIKSVQLFDLRGRILQTSTENSKEIAIDISGKSNGIYFLKVTSENGSKVEKLIKE